MQTLARASITIRPFTDDDYVVVTDLFNRTYTEFTQEVEAFRSHDRYPPHCLFARFVAECDGRLVGFADYSQNQYRFDPRKFELTLAVHPDYVRQGVGSQLYDRVLNTVQDFEPLAIDTWCREDNADLREFLERRGFAADDRLFTSSLDLRRFDPSAWTARDLGDIRLASLADLNAANPGVQWRLYDQWREIRKDLPRPPGAVQTDVPFEDWVEQNVLLPSLLPAAYFVAIDGDRYVGTSQLFSSPVAGELRTGMTGVRPAYRRRGLALALKLHALSFAKAQGYERVATENAAANVGMLAINASLGFVKNPAWIHYAKRFDAWRSNAPSSRNPCGGHALREQRIMRAGLS